MVVYLGNQLLYNVDIEEEDSWQYYKTGYILTGLIVSGGASSIRELQKQIQNAKQGEEK